MSRSPSPRRRLLPIALALCALAPGLAVAQTAREQALEARVAQLEAMVQQLVERQAAPPVATAPAQAATAAATAAARPTTQSTPILTAANPGRAFSFGGFIKFDAMATDTTSGEIPDGSVGRTFYVPSAIPVGGADEGVDTDFHALFSRLWFSADTALDSGDKVKAYLEFDLFGGGNNAFLGNEVATNTHGVTLRHAYVGWNKWLAGQTWSNFQDAAALPEAVDFVGPTEGTVFVRQAQLRYTSGPWAFSAENPQTTVTQFRNVGPRISSDDNTMPGLVARYTHKG